MSHKRGSLIKVIIHPPKTAFLFDHYIPLTPVVLLLETDNKELHIYSSMKLQLPYGKLLCQENIISMA